MASLLKHPQTTSVACTALLRMYDPCHWDDYYNHDITFSSAYREIMETLLALLLDDRISTKRRVAAMSALLGILDFESKDTILAVVSQYRAVLAMHSKPEGEVAVIHVLCDRIHGRGFRIFTASPGLLEDLMGVLLFGRKDPLVRLETADAIQNIVGNSTRLTLRVAAFPNALQMLFDLFVSQDMLVAYSTSDLQIAAGKILMFVTSVAENIIKFTEIQGIWEGLGAIIVKLEGARRKTRDCDLFGLEERASVAARILGNLGLEKDLRDVIASLPCVREGLRFLQMADKVWSGIVYRRAFTILYSNVRVAMPSSLNLQPLEEVLEATAACDERSSREWRELECCTNWSQVLTHILMGSYVESLSSLDRAQRHFDEREFKDSCCILCEFCSTAISVSNRDLRRCRVFLQAMLEDYTGAFQTRSTLDEFGYFHDGVLKRLSGDLQGALDDLNIAAEEHYRWGEPRRPKADTLKQRGYVKYLLDDEAGARKDAEIAQQLAEEEELGRSCYIIFDTKLYDLKQLSKIA